jgi:hypothetical protein
MDQPPDLAGLPLRPLPPAGGGAPPAQTSQILPAFMQCQQQSNWCWSAVATSVGLLFKTDNWTQCATVNGCLQSSDCCTSPIPSACNVYGYLDQSLTYTKSYHGPLLYGSISVADLEAQLNSGNPVCVRVAWNGGGAHFLSIAGYGYPVNDPASVTIYLQDSFYGPTSMALADFATNYHTGGDWTNTYLTKPNP